MASMMIDASQKEIAFDISQVGKMLLLILVLQAVFSYGRIVMFANVSERTMADIRRTLYEKLIIFPLGFFEKNRVGELSSRLAADVTQLQNALSVSMGEFLRQVFTLIAGIAIIAYTSPKLTLVMLSVFPVAVIAAMIFGRYIRKLSRNTQDALADSNVVVEESLQAIQIVKAFTNELFETKRYKGAIDRVVEFALKAARLRGFFVTFLVSAVFGGIVVVLWYGAHLVQTGGMSMGELIRFMLYTFFIGGAIGGMGDLYGNIQRSIGASERISDLLDKEGELNLQASQQPDGELELGEGIVYRNAGFSYPTRTDVRVLKNINLRIGNGQKIALVGASGAGKSTIVQLLMRFYELDKGAITINGRNIEQYNISHLRRNIGIVPQEVILFGNTIAENIRYGKPNATDEKVADAARKANAYDFIAAFPEGFETQVGERGVKLSGGQRQRIAIARAILKNPKILILDEATSSLDAESEKLVQDALDELMKNRTTIIIAHRLATIRKVDHIYVMNEGKVAEEGTHGELAELENGVYQNLLKLQFEME